MTTSGHKLIRMTDPDSRRLREILALPGNSGSGALARPPAVNGSGPVILGPSNTQPTQDPDGTEHSVQLRNLNGDTWEDVASTELDVTRISNGQRIAHRVGRHGLCVADVGFWAINVGTLTAPTTFLSAPVTGVAALLQKTTAGDLVPTDARVDFINRDPSLELDDGVPIILGYVSGDLTVLWASCSPAPESEVIGLDPDPVPEPGPGEES